MQDIVPSDNVPKLTLTDTTAKATASEHNRGYEGFLVDTPQEPIPVRNSSYKPSLQGPANFGSPPQIFDDVGMMLAAPQAKSPSPLMIDQSPDLLSVSYQPSRVAREKKTPENGSIETNGSNEIPNKYVNGEWSIVPYRPQSHQVTSEDQVAAPKPIIRVFSLGRNPKIRELPQEKMDDEILMCTEEKKIILLDWRTNGEDCTFRLLRPMPCFRIWLTYIVTNGVLMQMPRRDRNMRTPQGDLDLWKLVSIPLNVRRFFGRLNLMFFRGNYPDSQLFRMPGRPGERHTHIKRRFWKKRSRQPVTGPSPAIAANTSEEEACGRP